MNSHYQRTKSFFDKVGIEKGGYFDSPKSVAYFFQEQTKKEALKWIRNYKPRKILDAGCGRGDFTMRLAVHFPDANVEGIDFSSEMIREAKERYTSKNLHFAQADVLSLPFEDQSIDLLFLLGTFHIIHEKDFDKLIKEVTRVSRGAVILDFRNSKALSWRIFLFFFHRANQGIDCYGIEDEQLRVMFEKYGFSRVKSCPLVKVPLLSPGTLQMFTKTIG